MSAQYIKKCLDCDTVMSQCRCPGKKEVMWGHCGCTKTPKDHHIDKLCEICVQYSNEITKLQDRVDAYQQHTDEIIVALGSAGILSPEIVDHINLLKRDKGEMQLVAGRYQYQFEHAVKALNAIDDFFEYRFRDVSADTMQKTVRDHLAVFTAAVSKAKADVAPDDNKRRHCHKICLEYNEHCHQCPDKSWIGGPVPAIDDSSLKHQQIICPECRLQPIAPFGEWVQMSCYCGAVIKNPATADLRLCPDCGQPRGYSQNCINKIHSMHTDESRQEKS